MTEQDESAAVAQSAFLAESVDTERCPESTGGPESNREHESQKSVVSCWSEC